MEDIMLFRSKASEEGKKRVNDVLNRSTWWAKGHEIEEMESMVESRLGVSHAILMNSGTSTLITSLMALGISQGDEVIVPSYTFQATANAVEMIGATPVFADIEPDTLGLDYKDVLNKITPKTKAIILVHFGGGVSKNYESLAHLCYNSGIKLVEDSAHSFGASIGSINVGTLGHVSSFSLCFNKVLHTGEGGIVVTDDDELARKIRMYISHGRNEDKEYETIGFNMRMPSAIAGLGIGQLNELDKSIEIRNQIAKIYDYGLRDLDPSMIKPLSLKGNATYQMYNIYVNEIYRDSLKRHLKENGVPTRITYYPIHKTKIYKRLYNTPDSSLPVTVNMYNKNLTLPMHTELTDDKISYIIDKIREFVSHVENY